LNDTMKIHFECFECGAKKTKERIEKSTKDENLKVKCAKEFLKLMGQEFKENVCPAYIGTLQVKMVKRMTKCKDPFKKDKFISRKKLEKFAKKIENYIKGIKEEKKRFMWERKD